MIVIVMIQGVRVKVKVNQVIVNKCRHDMMIIWPSNSRHTSKWRKEVDGAWRMNIDIIVDDNDEDEEMEDGNELPSISKSKDTDSESEMSESESEQESSDDDN